jgi:RNA polymerase sigma-70 factor (ECF subfamily)
MTSKESSQFDALLDGARAGGKEAVDQFFDLICGFVTNQVKSRVHNEQDAQDLTQEVLLTVFTRLREIPAERVQGWLSEIVRHKIGDYIRRRRRNVAIFEPCSEEALISIPDALTSQPDWVFEANQLELLIERLWSSLTPDDQQVLSLLMDGFSQKNIAQDLDIPAGTVYSRVHRLRQKVEDQLKGELKKKSHCSP